MFTPFYCVYEFAVFSSRLVIQEVSDPELPGTQIHYLHVVRFLSSKIRGRVCTETLFQREKECSTVVISCHSAKPSLLRYVFTVDLGWESRILKNLPHPPPNYVETVREKKVLKIRTCCQNIIRCRELLLRFYVVCGILVILFVLCGLTYLSHISPLNT